MNAALNQGVAHGLVIGDVFVGNRGFVAELVLFGVEDGDFGGEVFGFENNCRGEVSEGGDLRGRSTAFSSLAWVCQTGLGRLCCGSRRNFGRCQFVRKSQPTILFPWR